MNIETSLNVENSIAIIGINGRFPGAKNIDEFWDNLKNGRESIINLSDRELLEAGINQNTIDDSNYVKAGAFLENIDLFDANFFGYNPKEASAIDPQHRIFLECAYSALETAGYNSEKYTGKIGIFAGVGWNNYLLFNLNPDEDFFQTASGYQTLIGNEKDFLTTRISYLLNLKGISLDLQTACSTSLVATSIACQSLLTYQSDMALAGGVSIASLKKTGYLYQEGGILSPDGHCRTFDAEAQGTVPGSGVGVIVLKRLEDALADGDNIQAIIRGSAINNDGSDKIGYTAPSIDGQAEVIAEALALAEVEPETISYIETHGTGTALGDPIEIAALNQVFRNGTECAIGSVKTNIGHLDAAAGVTGLIKTVLALKHQQIPPSLHFQQPNPKIDFANSPFYVNTELKDWKTPGYPRRAGVSSFGIGGTNAHVVLEEFKSQKSKVKSQKELSQLLVISAKTESALETATDNLVRAIRPKGLASHRKSPLLDLADVAYTLQVGRKEFAYRRMVVGKDIEDVAIALQNREAQRVLTHCTPQNQHSIVFMFSGQGSQYVNMGKELYETEPVFREWIDRCSELLEPELGLDLRSLLYPVGAIRESPLQQTEIAQPAIFTIEYALAQLWISWGIKPEAAIGHSIGEYVAATIAGVFSLKDALGLVAARGKLMQQMSTGSMLAVSLPEAEVKKLLNDELSLAAINAPSLCVVSGNNEDIERLYEQLTAKEIECRHLHTSHAFHSPMMDDAIALFAREVAKIELNYPQILFISNITGTWITTEEATNPDYWAKHARETVRFADGISELLQDSNRILLEVGAGKTLSTLVKRNSAQTAEQIVLSSLRHPKEKVSDHAFILNILGRLWLTGVEIDWSGCHANEKRCRVPLPTYPFERQRYWIEPQKELSEQVNSFNLWQSLVEAASKQSRQAIPDFDLKQYQVKKQELDDLCVNYMSYALKSLGVLKNPDGAYSSNDLFQQAQIIPRYQQLLCRWLKVLVEQGYLQEKNGRFSNILPIEPNKIEHLLEQLKAKWSDNLQQLDLIQNCGNNLASVLLGKTEPLELHTATLIKDDAVSRQTLISDHYYNSILCQGIKGLTQLLSPETKLRILEVGGGTGILTQDLLPILPSEQTEYTFTDIGSFFIKEAQQKFSDYPYVKYGVLNLEQSPIEQGYSNQSFDLIIAVNVLHITDNLQQTLQHIATLLAPGGLLIFQEITEAKLDFDITDGLLMKPLQDKQRAQGNPFLSPGQWRKELEHSRFSEVEIISGIEAFGQNIFIARLPESDDLSKIAFNQNIQAQQSELLEQKNNISDWFYVPSWKPTLISDKPKLDFNSSTHWLVFADELGVSDRLIQKLDISSENIIFIQAGQEFSNKNLDSHSFTLNPDSPEDYSHLLRELEAINFIPDQIIHCWNINSGDEIGLTKKTFKQAQKLGFYSLLYLTQAWANHQLDRELELIIFSNNMQSVTGEENLSPEKASLLGLVKVIPQEYNQINCRSVDIVLPKFNTWQEEKLLDKLAMELTNLGSDTIVAYRSLKRWAQTFEPIQLKAPVETSANLRSGGVYLIIGGLGSLGLILAQHLARTCQAKLILTGRSPIPDRDLWLQWLKTHDEKNEISQKIKQLLEIETLDANILTFSADSGNLEQMQNAIALAETKFGQINGVIHCVATGLTETMKPIENTNEIECENQFQGKAYGLLVLEEILQHKKIDFCILVSSLASIFGGVGHAAYSASNLFMDAYIHQHNQISPHNWISVNWDGRISSVAQQDDENSWLKMRPELTMTASDDIAVFNQILSQTNQLDHVVISTKNLFARIKQWKANKSLENKSDRSRVVNLSSTYSRPKLSTTYVEPRNEIEETIANIWQQILGIEKIGIDDNFFELGGDSLSGVTFINQFRKQMRQNIAVSLMFEMPTIAELANHLNQKTPKVVLANGKNNGLIAEREEGVI